MYKERCHKAKFRDGDLMISISSDSVGITKNRGAPYSVTPILIKILNLPPWLRSRAEFSWLWGLVPGPKPFKNSELYLDMLLPEMKQLSDGIIIPYDAYTGETNVLRRVHILFTINDLRAVPKLNMQKQTPSRYGACNLCDTIGFKVGPYPVYPGSISYIPEGRLKQQYRRDMPVDWRRFANQPPTQHQTDASIQNNYENLGSNECMYKRMDPFLALPFWRTHRHHVNDPSHLIANFTEIIWSLLTNTGKYAYKTKHHELETRRNFRDMDQKYPPWTFPPPDIKMVTKIIENADYFDSKIPNPCTHISAFKFSHWYSLCSNLGIFIIEQSHLRKQYKELFIDLTNMLRILLKRSITINEIHQAGIDAHKALALMELICPLRVNSVVKHHMHHIFDVIEYMGPPLSFWM